MKGEVGPFSRSQHHNAHDAFAVCPLTVLFHPDFPLILVGNAHDHGCRAGVNAHLVGHFQHESLGWVTHVR